MKHILTWIIMVPLALVVIVFSAVNLELVTLDLWPLPMEITVPLYALVLCVFIVGFVLGGIVAWASAGESRKRARNNMWRAEKAERELRSVSNKLHDRERELADETEKKSLPATTPGA